MSDVVRGAPTAEEVDEFTKALEEVVALMSAWADRGMHPASIGYALASVAHQVLIQCGESLEKFQGRVAKMWESKGGLP